MAASEMLKRAGVTTPITEPWGLAWFEPKLELM